MKNILVLSFLLFTLIASAQTEESTNQNSDFTIIMDAGLLIGHSESHYPAPFTSNISFLYKMTERFQFGFGSGVEVIGKTFVPLFFDVRYIPFKNKPLFLYNKAGATFCINKSYSEQQNSNNNYYYYDVNYPHPLNEKVETNGGLINECGFGIVLQRSDWKTSISLGYNYQTTSDTVKEPTKKTYENTFNRVALRIGFWF